MIHTQPLILKFVGDPAAAEGVFSGLGSTWSIDRQNEKIAPGAFAKTIAAMAAGAQHVPLLFGHDASKVIGTVTSAEETDDGLKVSGKLILGEPTADRAQQLLAAKAVGLSVGFLPRPGAITTDANGIRTYQDVDWMELSIVSLPANAQAVVHQVRSLAAISRSEFKAALLEGAPLPAMPRRMVEKMTKLCFGDGGLIDGTDDDDSPELLEVQRGLDALLRTLKDGK